MTDTRDAVLDEVTHRSRNLSLPELVGLIERGHPDSQGVSRETLGAYADVLANEPDFAFETEEFAETIDDALVGTETWVSGDALYDLGDDRISVYPPAWHERLGGETDVREYLRYLGSDESGFADSDPYDDGGVPESTLLDIVPIVGRTNRDAVKGQIEDRRAAGEITEGPDQHPDARVKLDSST